MNSRTAWLCALAWMLPVLMTSGQALAQAYPNKPVKIIVAYPAGGATDVIARAVGTQLSEMWGQPVVIENKGGAGTALGAEAVARSPNDGYTFLATAEATFVVNPFLYPRLPYDAEKDFIPVTGLGIINQVLVTHPSANVSDVKDLIAQAKAKPGAFNYGTLGVGSSAHLNMTMFEGMSGTKMTAIHYKGGGPAIMDLIGGHIPVMFVSTTLMAQPWKAGQVKAIAVGSTRRLSQFPDLPTVAESGLSGFRAVSWFGLFAPAGTPQDIVNKVNADVQKVIADPDFQKKFMEPNYYESIPGNPSQFADYVRTDAARWKKIIKDANLKLE